MASTVTIDGMPSGRVVQSDRKIRRGTIQLGTYATSGVAVTASQFDLPCSLDDLRISPTDGYVFTYNKATGKVFAYRQKNPAAGSTGNIPLPEVGAVSIATIVARYRAVGR